MDRFHLTYFGNGKIFMCSNRSVQKEFFEDIRFFTDLLIVFLSLTLAWCTLTRASYEASVTMTVLHRIGNNRSVIDTGVRGTIHALLVFFVYVLVRWTNCEKE